MEGKSKSATGYHVTLQYVHDVLCCTFMESTAELWAAVLLVLTGAASVPFSCIGAALPPHTQLTSTALLVFSARLKAQRKPNSFSNFKI